MTKTYFITDSYDNTFLIEFIYSTNPKYIVLQYIPVRCDGYLNLQTMHLELTFHSKSLRINELELTFA